MKLVCRLRPQPNNTSMSSINSRKEVRNNIFAGGLSNESPQTLVVSSRYAIAQKIIAEYLKSDSDIMKQRQSIIENADLFQFDQVFGEKANQQLLYDQVCAPKVNGVITGNSATILLLGGPDSGKKYTLKGEERGQEKGLAVLAVENLLNLIEGSKQLRGKGKVMCSISCVNNTEVIDLVGSSRNTTIKSTLVKSGSEFKKLLNQSLFQYKQYVKEHPETKNNHIFLKLVIQQDKQEIAQLHFIIFNELRRVNAESKEFQGKLKQLLIGLQDYQEKDLDSKSLSQLYLSLRETKFSNITVLFCVSQVQSDHLTAYMTLQFADELRQGVKPQTARVALSQLDNQSQKSRVSFGKENITQQLGSKASLDSKFDRVDRTNKPGSDATVLHHSKIYSERPMQDYSKQFQELKDLLKEKEVMDDYKVQRVEKELKNLYDENARLQAKVYQQEDSIKQRDLLILQLEQHMEDNKKQLDLEQQICNQAKSKENLYQQNQEELSEAVAQLNAQLRFSNEESQMQKQRVKMLQGDIEMLKEQEFMNVKHYEKREDEFMALIQEEQQRNKQLYGELDYFAVELKGKEQQLQVAEDNIKTLNKVIEEQCKRIDEEKSKSKELAETIEKQKQQLDTVARDMQQQEARFLKLKTKVETENQALVKDRDKYLSKYKDKLKKYKTALKTAESENAAIKLERVKLITENDQLYGISKQLETKLKSESTERMDPYENDKFRQQNLQLNSQLKQADYEISQLTNQLNNAIHQLELTNAEYDHILEDNQGLQKLLDAHQTESKEKEMMIEKMVEMSEKQLDDLESKFNKVTAQVNALQHEKKSLISENLNLKQQLEQLDGNDVVLERRIVKLRKENKELSRQIRDLNQNMKEMIVEKHSEMKNTSLRVSSKMNQSYRSQKYSDDDDDEF